MVWRRTWISTWPEGSMRPELGRTQYLEEHVLEVVGTWKGAAVDVLFGSSGLDLEGDRSACRVGEAQDLGDFMGERACSQWICQPGGRKLAIWPVVWQDQADVRLKPSSDGDSSTDMV